MRLQPIGGAYSAPRPPGWFLGGRFAAGEGKEESRGEGREGGKGEGRVAFPHFFLNNLTIACTPRQYTCVCTGGAEEVSDDYQEQDDSAVQVAQATVGTG